MNYAYPRLTILSNPNNSMDCTDGTAATGARSVVGYSICANGTDPSGIPNGCVDGFGADLSDVSCWTNGANAGTFHACAPQGMADDGPHYGGGKCSCQSGTIEGIMRYESCKEGSFAK